MSQDRAHKQTDEIIEKVERKVSAVYRQAASEMQETVNKYFERFIEQDKEQKAKVDSGEITETEYKQWRRNKMATGERYKAMQKKLAERFTNANEIAIKYVNESLPEIYAINMNFSAYELEKIVGDLDFTLFDESTVKKLIVENPDLMPYYPKEMAVKRGIDLAYGKEQITRTITSSILQGKSIPNITKDLMNRLQGMNKESATRAARTAATSAENAGRMATYKKASDMGIKVRKRWIATKDGRTRDSHRALDGQTVDWDKPFNSKLGKIMHPGDRSAKPANVYNCRCSLRTVEKDGIEAESRQMRVVTGAWDELDQQERKYKSKIDQLQKRLESEKD